MRCWIEVELHWWWPVAGWAGVTRLRRCFWNSVSGASRWMKTSCCWQWKGYRMLWQCSCLFRGLLNVHSWLKPQTAPNQRQLHKKLFCCTSPPGNVYDTLYSLLFCEIYHHFLVFIILWTSLDELSQYLAVILSLKVGKEGPCHLQMWWYGGVGAHTPLFAFIQNKKQQGEDVCGLSVSEEAFRVLLTLIVCKPCVKKSVISMGSGSVEVEKG